MRKGLKLSSDTGEVGATRRLGLPEVCRVGDLVDGIGYVLPDAGAVEELQFELVQAIAFQGGAVYDHGDGVLVPFRRGVVGYVRALGTPEVSCRH